MNPIALSAHRNLEVADTFKRLPRIDDDSGYATARLLQELSSDLDAIGGEVYRPGDIVIEGKPPIHYPDGFDGKVIAVGERWEVYRKRESGGGFLGIVDDPTTRPDDADAISVGLIYVASDEYGSVVIPCRGVNLRGFAKVVSKMIFDKRDLAGIIWWMKAVKFYAGPGDGSGRTIYYFDLEPK